MIQRLIFLAALFILPHSATGDEPSLVPPQPCEKWLAVINPTFKLYTDEKMDHESYIRDLEREIVARTENGKQILRPTQVRGRVQFERALFVLAAGRTDELMSMMRSPASDVDEGYDRLVVLANKIAPLHEIEDLTTEEAKTLFELEQKFIVESVKFGESYGFFKNMIQLLESVNAGFGVPNMDLFPSHDILAEKNTTVVLDLTSTRAKATARTVLGILNAGDISNLGSVRKMFANNRYALRAKLERDLRELRSMNALWRKAGNGLAQFIMFGSEKIPYISEKMRDILIKMAGVQVKQFMFNFYLNKIHDVVNVTRIRTSDGKIVLLNDELSINEQIREVNEAAASGVGEDFLVTFARLPYFRTSWTALVEALEIKAKGDTHEAREHQMLLRRMIEARAAAVKLKDITYVYDPANAEEIQVLAIQATYLIGTEEVARLYIWPFIQKLLH